MTSLPRMKHASRGKPIAMYSAKCAKTGHSLGLSFAKLTDKPLWAFVQTHGFCDGVYPWADFDISKPIVQSFGNTESIQYHEDGFVTCWDSTEGRRTYCYRLVVFDEKKGVWGKEAVESKPGESFTVETKYG